MPATAIHQYDSPGARYDAICNINEQLYLHTPFDNNDPRYPTYLAKGVRVAKGHVVLIPSHVLEFANKRGGDNAQMRQL